MDPYSVAFEKEHGLHVNLLKIQCLKMETVIISKLYKHV